MLLSAVVEEASFCIFFNNIREKYRKKGTEIDF